MRSFAIEEPGSLVPALYATLVWISFLRTQRFVRSVFTIESNFHVNWKFFERLKLEKVLIDRLQKLKIYIYCKTRFSSIDDLYSMHNNEGYDANWLLSSQLENKILVKVIVVVPWAVTSYVASRPAACPQVTRCRKNQVFCDWQCAGNLFSDWQHVCGNDGNHFCHRRHNFWSSWLSLTAVTAWEEGEQLEPNLI